MIFYFIIGFFAVIGISLFLALASYVSGNKTSVLFLVSILFSTANFMIIVAYWTIWNGSILTLLIPVIILTGLIVYIFLNSFDLKYLKLSWKSVYYYVSVFFAFAYIFYSLTIVITSFQNDWFYPCTLGVSCP